LPSRSCEALPQLAAPSPRDNSAIKIVEVPIDMDRMTVLSLITMAACWVVVLITFASM
jgi:hypothetical protein